MDFSVLDRGDGGEFLPAGISNRNVARGYYLEKEKYLPVNFDVINKDFRIHKRLVSGTSGDYAGSSPVLYIRVGDSSVVSPNVLDQSSSTDNVMAVEYYDEINRRLVDLATAPNDDEIVEKGAARTALSVINVLRNAHFAPPELSWHGGDAVVMLWAMGSTTYAITVTDGELGYVVRRNRKTVHMKDSIALEVVPLKVLGE